MAMAAAAPLERARRIAAGQVAGSIVIVAVAAAAAALLYEFSPLWSACWDWCRWPSGWPV